jgi:hypothetical protein
MNDTIKLRAIAEAAKIASSFPVDHLTLKGCEDLQKFRMAFEPQAVLALLDALEGERVISHGLETELANLRHDIERHVAIASEEAEGRAKAEADAFAFAAQVCSTCWMDEWGNQRCGAVDTQRERAEAAEARVKVLEEALLVLIEAIDLELDPGFHSRAFNNRLDEARRVLEATGGKE